MNKNLKKMIMTALFAALACVATMSIRIPTPGTSGYIHPGDAVVILSGIILGPAYGFLAGGIGSAMADLIGGYFLYVPITFVIKGLIALICGFIYQKLGTSSSKTRYTSVALGGITDIILVAGGYFFCESFMYGIAGAAASIPANIIQGVSGLVIAVILYPILIAIPDVRQLNTTPKTNALPKTGNTSKMSSTSK
ncbi:MAG: ECF transporter S component [Clostridia bacterium]|nr:ECF transporter S component [Clostridia bacterium]NCC44072.1 ECF transporter S component [Clostridia bacterium]